MYIYAHTRARMRTHTHTRTLLGVGVRLGTLGTPLISLNTSVPNVPNLSQTRHGTRIPSGTQHSLAVSINAMTDTQIAAPYAPIKAYGPMGAPRYQYDIQAAVEICERISQGEGLRDVCSKHGLPSWPTIRKWLATETDFAIRYARAREASAEVLELEAIEIADNPDLDPNDKRIRVDTRKWAAAKRNPRIYGEKIDLNVSGSLAVAPALDVSKLTPEELMVLERLLAKAKPEPRAEALPAGLVIEHEAASAKVE